MSVVNTRTRAACLRLAAALLVIFSWAWISPPQALAQLPPLPGSLVVTITFPTSRSTVSGTTTVSASVSIVGSLVVAGVQFQLDGASLGAEDTTAPYSVSWDTTGTSNGSHTLTAVARDTLGLRFTSDPVAVTVSNDKTRPAVTINQAAGQADPTSTAPINFTAVFSESVGGFTGADVTISGTAGGTKTVTVTGGPSTYNVAVSGMTTGGTVIATIAAGVASDGAGNTNTASTSTDNTVTFTPPDSTPPTVAITSPSGGTTVSDVITVTASATDAGGVTLVQFLVNDVEVGRDTTTPYEATWDTRTVPNGTYTLQARAQDTAGNIGTSAVVTVTVANGAPPPPGTVTRFEETDPSVAFSAGWVSSSSARWSGGIAAVSTTAGAQASFTFTGTSVSWIGFRGPMAGIARVSLDGVLIGDVDMFAPTEEFRSVVFTRTDLADASHTLTIEVTGLKNAASTDTFIVVDAFDVPAPTVTRFQETDPSVSYTAGWTQGITGAWSGGTAAVSTAAGAQATFTFTGTSVSWIGFRGPQAGIARVILDGVLVDEVDTFAPTEDTQVVIFTATGLADAGHTLTIEVTGLKNAASTDTTIAVDAFEVTSSQPPTAVSRFEETDPSVAYTAGWFGDASARWSGGMAALSTTAGARAAFTFTGTSVSWIGFRGPQAGIARVLLDGVLVGEVDTFAPTEEFQAVVLTRTGLAPGSHTLTIEVTGLRNPASTDTFIVVDAFDVTS